MIPLSELASVEFYILGSEENKINSFVEVKTSETFKQGKAVDNGVYDLSMGTFNYDMKCKVCKKTNTTCQGHMGHINLRYPSKSPLFIPEIPLWLKSVCFNCSNLLSPIEKLNKIQQSNTPRSKILNEGAGKNFSGNNKIIHCPHCGLESPNITKNKGEALILYAEYYDMKMVNGKKTFEIRSKEELTNIQLKNVLDKISDETVLMLGKPLISHPRKLVTVTQSVSPNTIRPDKKKTSNNNAFNSDITSLLQGVIDSSNNVPKNINTTKYNNLDDIGKVIEVQIYSMIKGTAGNKTNITNHSKQQLISLAKRQTGKRGRVRKNMMGKRVENAARSTITCGPHLELDEIGMPIEICRDISFPVHVQDYNYDECNYYFKNGLDIYPGCKKIKKIETGKEYSTTSVNIKKYILKIGDIIYRDLIDGDYFNFTRAPSLEPSSMTSMRIKVIEYGLTMSMNVITCVLFNADFDGDAMTANFSPSLSTATEIELLSSVNERMLPYKKSSSMIGQAQDSLIGTANLTHNKIKMNKYHANKLFNIINEYHDFSKYSNDKIFTGRDIISILFKEMDINLNYKTTATYYSAAKKLYRTYDPDNVNVEFKDGVLISGILDKKSIGQKSTNTIFHIVAKSHGTNKALDLCYKIQQIALEFLNYCSVSISIRDVIVQQEFLDEIYKIETSLISNSLEITQRLNDNKIISPLGQTLKEYYEEMQIAALDIGDKYFEPYIKNLDIGSNSMNALVEHGSKGSINNIKNYCVQIGQIYLDGQRIPETFGRRTCSYFPNYDSDPKARGYITNSYMSGMDPAEFYFHSIDDRNGLIAIALSTSVSGSASRSLIKNLEPNIITNKRFVRSNNKINKTLYGGDGLDPRYLEYVKILTANPKLTDKEFEKMYKHNDKEFETLKNGRTWFIKFKLKNEKKYNEIYDNNMFSVFNIKRIIENTKIDNNNIDKTFDKNKAIIDINNLCESIKYSYFNEEYQKQKKKLPYNIEKVCKLYIIYIKSWLNIHNLINSKISNNLLTIIISKILIKFNNSFMDYGTCVGDIASLSYAEPITQSVINSKHGSGLGKQSTGISRINELLGNSPTLKMKTPFITLELKDKYAYNSKTNKINELKIQKIINKLRSFDVSMFVNKYQIFVEEYAIPVHPLYRHEIIFIREFEKFNGKSTEPLINFCIRLEFIKMVMIEKKISISDIALQLSQIFNFIHIVFTPDNVEKLVMRIYFQNRDQKSIEIDKQYVTKFIENLPTIIIRGIPGISNITKTFSINNKISDDGSLHEYRTLKFSISGMNVTDIISTKYFKNNTLVINAIRDIEERFGILAARMMIAKELSNQIGGSISYRHVALFADEMTSTGVVTSLNRFGSRKRNTSVLLRISDSDPIRVLSHAAINNIKDTLTGVSPSLMVGKYPCIGTTFNNISLDEDFIISEMKNESEILNDL